MLQKYRGYRGEAGLHLLGAGFSGIGMTRGIGKELDVLRLTEAQKAPSSTVGKIYNVDKEKWVKTITRKKTPYFKSELLVDAPIFQKSEIDFILGASKAKQKVSFLPFTEQIGNKGWRLVEQEAIIGAKSKVAPAIVSGIKVPKVSATYGRGYVQPLDTITQDLIKVPLKVTMKSVRGSVKVDDPFGRKIIKVIKTKTPSTKGTSYFDFGGVSKDMGDFLHSKGGKAVSKRVFPEVSGPVSFTDDFIEIPLKTRLIIKPKDTSVIFKKVPKIKDDFGLTITKVSGKKSSKEYFQGLYQAQTQEFTTPSFGEFASTVGETLTKQASKTIITAPKSISPVVAYSTMKSPKQKDMLNQFFDSGYTPKIKSIVKAKKKEVIKVIPKVGSRPGQLYSPASDTEIKSASIPKSKTKQKPIQRQRLQQTQVFSPSFEFGVDFGFGRAVHGAGFDFDFGLQDKKKYSRKKAVKKQPSKKKPRKYVARITGFEAALGLGPRYVEAGKKFTGFEVTRGKKVKTTKKKGTKKKPIDKKWRLY
jgi:hypothetical protein